MRSTRGTASASGAALTAGSTTDSAHAPDSGPVPALYTKKGRPPAARADAAIRHAAAARTSGLGSVLARRAT
jgi:hypothetical protein